MSIIIVIGIIINAIIVMVVLTINTCIFCNISCLLLIKIAHLLLALCFTLLIELGERWEEGEESLEPNVVFTREGIAVDLRQWALD